MNLGNYESADASCMLTAFIDENDNTAEVQAELWRMAKDNVKHALAQYRQSITVDELMLGLKIEQSSPVDWSKVPETLSPDELKLYNSKE